MVEQKEKVTVNEALDACLITLLKKIAIEEKTSPFTVEVVEKLAKVRNLYFM